MQGGGGSRLTGSTESRAINYDRCDWSSSVIARNAVTKQTSDPQGRQCSSGVCHWLTQLRCAGLPRGANAPRNDVGFLCSAFTMAEILLSLTIIGVVAAITLPSLTGNINERTWNTQRKALYARFSQAIALMPALNGYGTYRAASGTEGSESYDAGADNAAETFLTAGLSKVLKMNNICDATHLTDCGLPKKVVLANGDTKSFPSKMSELNSAMTSGSLVGDTLAAGFETANGESIAVFYNPNCTSDMKETTHFYSQPKMCANFVYDLNGNKGPNTFGKDLGVMTAMYASDSVVVAPVPTTADPGASAFQMTMDINKKCRAIDPDSKLPNREELSSLFYNSELISFSLGNAGNARGDYWATPVQPTSATAWCLRTTTGQWLLGCMGGNGNIRCIKR